MKIRFLLVEGREKMASFARSCWNGIKWRFGGPSSTKRALSLRV